MTLNLDEMRQTHVPKWILIPGMSRDNWACEVCEELYPCTVRQLLDLLETVEARAEGLRAAQKHIRDLQAQLEQARTALFRIAHDADVIYLSCADIPFCSGEHHKGADHHDADCAIGIARAALAGGEA